MTVPGSQMVITLPSTHGAARLLQPAMAAAVIQHSSVEAEDLQPVILAVTEAVTNACIHGNKLNPALEVTVHLACEANRLTVSITDCGSGFSPDEVPDPRTDDRVMQPGGRGLLVMRELATELRFERLERGMQVLMVFQF